MLYTTTRNPEGSYTARQAIFSKRAPDGGFFMPYRQVYFYSSQLRELENKSFLQAEAEVLNILLSSDLTEWDLNFAAGPGPVHLQKIGRRTISGERWRNTGWTFESYVKQVMSLLGEGQPYGPWAEIAVGAALLLSMYAVLRKKDLLPKETPFDVAVGAENLKATVSALWLKTWGVPIGQVVCGCRDSKGLWELLHDGMLHTDVLEPGSPAVDDLEMLLGLEAYQAEVRRFLNCVDRGKNYVPAEGLLRKLREDLGVSVISEKRMQETIPGVYATKQYLLSMDGALSYAALMDFRAVSGSGNRGLVLSDQSPLLHLSQIAESLHMEESAVRKLLQL